jgi:hypothetical protein
MSLPRKTRGADGASGTDSQQRTKRRSQARKVSISLVGAFERWRFLEEARAERFSLEEGREASRHSQ